MRSQGGGVKDMDYFKIICDSIDYIENNIKKPLTPDEIAGRYYISKYHFYRIFKALVNKTIKEYIDERRLTHSAIEITQTGKKILDIAFEYGYKSQEVFTRSFKRHFSIAPIIYRKTGCEIHLSQKACIAEREFKNCSKDIIADFKITHMDSKTLAGVYITLNPYDNEELNKLSMLTGSFTRDYINSSTNKRLYCITDVKTIFGSRVSYFYGYEPDIKAMEAGLKRYTIIGSDYAVFKYTGDMKKIHSSVFNDVYKAVIISNLSFNNECTDIIEIYEQDYYNTNQFYVYVPISDNCRKNNQENPPCKC